MAEDTRTLQVTFPRQLLEELDAVVPTGKRSEVTVAATAAYLRRINVLAALRETHGAWRDEDHPGSGRGDHVGDHAQRGTGLPAEG